MKEFLVSILIASLFLMALLYEKAPNFSGKILSPFLQAQIDEDLKDLSITNEEMDHFWQTTKATHACVRYKYIDGRLFSSADRSMRMYTRYIVITEALEKIFSLGFFPDLDWIIHFGDSPNENEWELPLFTFAKNQAAKRPILMPDCEALNPTDRRYLTKVMNEGRKKNTWQQKIDRVFWRGSPTGPLPNLHDLQTNHWKDSPRFYLVKFSETLPQLIDAAFVSWDCIHKNKELLVSLFRLAETVNPKDHLGYKYLIDVDGNSCCYSRTFWILLSNSLLLKQTTDEVQWFYKGLKPFVHFIPLECQLGDLENKIAYAQENEKEVQTIISQANEFANNHLQYEENLFYLSQLLRKYASCLHYKPCVEEGDLRASVPVYRKIYFEAKAYLRKIIKNKPIARIHDTPF